MEQVSLLKDFVDVPKFALKYQHGSDLKYSSSPQCNTKNEQHATKLNSYS